MVYVADSYNNRIRKITPLGAVTTLAGTGGTTYANGVGTSTANFYYPNGIAVDGGGRVFVVDGYSRVRVISPEGAVEEFAGSSDGRYWADGSGTNAAFFEPQHLAAAPNGNLLVVDGRNYRLRLVTPVGVVTTLAGKGIQQYLDDFGTAASFRNPSGVAVDAQGTVTVSDENRLRSITCAACPPSFACNTGVPLQCPANFFCPPRFW